MLVKPSHRSIAIRLLLLLAVAAFVPAPAHAERLLGYSFVDEVVFKIDTETGELIKFFGHNINQLGGLDIDSQGNLYYMANNTLLKIDLGQPANDEFIGSTPKVIFESFEIVDDVGYTGEVFTGIFYSINLSTGAATPIGQYGVGGYDRITGLASTDYPGSFEPLAVYGVRVFIQDIIEIDIEAGQNLGTFIADPVLNTTNLAYGPGQTFWFVAGGTLYRLDAALEGLATPVIEELDVSGVDGLTVVHPEPSIVTESLPGGVVDAPYGPVTLELDGGSPSVQWVALSDGYEEIDLGDDLWEMVGDAQGLTGDDVVMAYALPFPFPYYGESYTQVWICNNGFIDFEGPATNPNNNVSALIGSKRIAPLWDDLRTDFGGRDVHIDESVPGEVTIRWDCLTDFTFGVVNFSCTLHQTGAIQLNYWVPNENLSPTVGISAGDGESFIISRYNGMSDLGQVNSLRYEPLEGLPPGLALSADGVIDGIPLEAGSFTATIRLTDSLGGFDERDLTVDVIASCVGDVSGPTPGVPDGVVNVSDLILLLGQWGTDGAADITGSGGAPDGTVDVLDLVALINGWGEC